MSPFLWNWFIFSSIVESVPWKWVQTEIKPAGLCYNRTWLQVIEDGDLGKVALLIDKCQHVHRFACEHIQSVLVVLVVNVLPHNLLTGILFLLKLENMPDEELLELLIGKVDAQLLKAANEREIVVCSWKTLMLSDLLQRSTCFSWSSQSQRCREDQWTVGHRLRPRAACKWQHWFCLPPK